MTPQQTQNMSAGLGRLVPFQIRIIIRTMVKNFKIIVNIVNNMSKLEVYDALNEN